MSLLKHKIIGPLTMFFCVAGTIASSAAPGRQMLHGHVPNVVARLQATGLLPATNHLSLAIGLPLRNPAALDELLHQLYDPHSPNFRQFLAPEKFTEKFGPTEQDYQKVIAFARENRLTVTAMHGNRLLLDVSGSVTEIEQAFHIALCVYQHPHENRTFYSPNAEPSADLDTSLADISGLNNYSLPHPKHVRINSSNAAAKPTPKSGSAPDPGNYMGNDFRNAYVPGTALTGAAQMVGLIQFDGFYSNDIVAYENLAGLPNVPVQAVLINGVSGAPGYLGIANGNIEVSLDIEMAIAMAPGLARVLVFEGSNPNSVLNTMAASNTVKNLSSSWGWSGGPTVTTDNIFKTMAAQGQSFFNASGDSGAFPPGAADASTPSSSPYITQVGGTVLAMNGAGDSYASEMVWAGSSGGVSSYYSIPDWQANVNAVAAQGSASFRNVPDVAMTADNVYVTYGNGAGGYFAGTSCAAPLWAGFTALANQQSVAVNGSPVGFLNPAIYAVANNPNYAACFNDITVGNNNGFYAVPGYDLCTGLGTPNGTNLINALALPLPPYFLTQPASQIVTSGKNIILSVTVGHAPPFGYTWLFNGTNLPIGGNISITASNVLSLTAVTTNNGGSYSVIVTNLYGATTSSIAILNVGFIPTLSVAPASQTNLTGSSTAFIATTGGSTPQAYQWRRSGTNIANGPVYSGVTTTNLTLTALTTNHAGNYTLVATNLFGVRTSSVVALTVVLPPKITGGIGNRTMECGSNVTFTITTTGTPPLRYQWSFDGLPAPGATNASLSFTNVHLPSHTVSVVVTNLYASATSNALLSVNDTKAPVVTLSGGNLLFSELGSAFNDPGASATDTCAGSLFVSINGTANTNAVGTNTITYRADDGNGNTNAVTRQVVVRDTTPPSIVWSFTNLFLAAGTNCNAIMPDVTGTNFILAADLSGTLVISQSPATNFILPLGTNRVVITVRDAFTNKTFSTNTLIVGDQTPPFISSQPPSRTNTLGTAANFSVAATACTPLGYQWFFENVVMVNQTNNSLPLLSVGLTNAGKYSVVVSASGGSTTSAVATLTVDLIATSVALTSSTNPSGYHDSVNFTVVVMPADAGGTVQFLTNNAFFDLETLAAGTAASTNIASLPRGTNSVSAIYSGDAGHLPATNTITQIVTNHPPSAAAVFYSGAAGFPLNIAVADLATNWLDIDGDLVSLVDFSVSTNGVVLTNNAGTLVYFNSNRVADQFVCAISDGWDTNFQNVNLVPPAPPTPNITGVAIKPDGSFNLDLIGVPGDTYVLETTTSLESFANWQPVTTNTLGTNGVWHFTDLSATNFPQQFYRLKLVP